MLANNVGICCDEMLRSFAGASCIVTFMSSCPRYSDKVKQKIHACLIA